MTRLAAKGRARERALHARPAHDRAVALVGHVVDAEGVAVREQNALAESDDDGGIGQSHDAVRLEQRIADEEIAVAGHEADRPFGGGGGEHLGAARFEAALGHVVADPDLEQVAEDERRRRRRCGAGAPPRPRTRAACSRPRCRSESRSIARQCAGATKVGGDSAFGSAGACGDDAATVPAASARPLRRQETTVARVIVTSSSGTSAWPPRLPVRTFSIASTTSWPETTRPKTA